MFISWRSILLISEHCGSKTCLSDQWLIQLMKLHTSAWNIFFITQSRAKLQIKTYIPISEQNLPFHKKVKIILYFVNYCMA